jgi:hypothetical protein
MQKPHSLSTITIEPPPPPPNIFVQRFGDYGKGTVLPETQVPHSPRRKVADFPEGFLKQSHIEHLEHNQKIPHCCRHPENHEVEARKSHPDEPAPDVYIFHCTCGNQHRFLCVGQSDVRPEWR